MSDQTNQIVLQFAELVRTDPVAHAAWRAAERMPEPERYMAVAVALAHSKRSVQNAFIEHLERCPPAPMIIERPPEPAVRLTPENHDHFIRCPKCCGLMATCKCMDGNGRTAYAPKPCADCLKKALP